MNKVKIEEIIKTDVNPILMQHSGFVILAGIETEPDFEIILEFHGGCQGCPLQYSSTLQLIENIFKDKLKIAEVKVINSALL